ncbi:AGE family epimerase/isomerase [Leucobacter sp. NPDC058333]|uniref:AGE family epimerase/isomerase n=1 Tax=Leucobacter sp. NPDC058333 TaxID=3346450 RepID=UPI003648DFDC
MTEFAIDSTQHHDWLGEQTTRLLAFSAPALDAAGGFSWLDDAGAPVPGAGKQLWINGRYTYSAVVGHLLGYADQAERVEHGLTFLRSGSLRDTEYGGWRGIAEADDASLNSDAKESYGISFVLLAAAAARLAGFDADELYADALAVLDRFWDAGVEMYADTWNRDFTELDEYRGQNPNMHLVEAQLLAFEVDGEARHIERATAIARRLIRDVASAHDWRLPEHYHADWRPHLEYGADSPDSQFRPYGATVGHWLEWARLLVQLAAAQRELRGRDGAVGGSAADADADADAWILPAAQSLFSRAVTDAWDEDRGGLAFSTDWSGGILNDHRFHWVIAEAIGAATALYRVTGDASYAEWYERFWRYAADHHITGDGSWIHELDADGAPASGTWSGKPDLYHALQATLFSRLPVTHSLVTGARRAQSGDTQ